MLMVILSHYYCHGAFPEDSFLSINKFGMQMLGSGGKIAVDIFVIITGYFLVKQKFSLLKLCKFFSCTYFWSILILVFAIFLFGYNNLDERLVKNSLNPLTPINWFARAYLHLYIIFPLVNKIIDHMTKRKHIYAISILTIMMFVVPTLLNKILGGYLNYLITFVDLYLIGAYLRLYANPILDKKLKIIGTISYLIILLSILVFDYKGSYDEFYMIKKNIMVFPYNGSNFLVLLTAVAMFVWFKNIRIATMPMINTVAATTFAVYLIHDNGLLSDWIWNSMVCGWRFYESDFLVIHMLVSCCVVFLTCSVVEWLRIRYFEKPLLNKLKNLFRM